MQRIGVPIIIVLLLVIIGILMYPSFNDKKSEQSTVLSEPDRIEVDDKEEIEQGEINQDDLDRYYIEIGDYFNERADLLIELTRILNNFTQLNKEINHNYDVIYSDSWLDDMSTLTADMKNLIKSAHSIHPPEDFKKAHEITLEGLNHYEFVVNHFYDSVKNVDRDLMDKVSKELNLGADLVEVSNLMIDEFMEQLF